jgi:hypothetical protein
MADLYGSNYNKEWIADPSEAADKGSQNAKINCFLDEVTGIAATDKLYLCKIQTLATFLGLEALVGTIGAGALEAIDKDGNATAINTGDLLDGGIEGGLDIVLTADGATSATLKVLVKTLKD